MSAGVEVQDRYTAVHTDALGMQDLYYRRIGGAVYFSGRIEPLVELDDAPLHVNWGAWASTLALTAPIGEDTPFVEIRRLSAASAWVVRDGKLHMESFEPSWMAEAVDPSFGAADAVDALAGSLHFDKRTVLALSGGWDSRLLGILARRRTSRMEAWTTSPDDGRDLDIEYARPVAEQLGMRHRVVVPDERGWLDEFREVRRRTSFQTIHHVWLMPLARALHDEGAPMLDGLAGDVLFKATYVPEALFSEREPEKQRQLLWEGLENRRLRSNEFLRPEVAASFIDLNSNAFATAMESFSGHDAAVTLGKIHTRAARAIAPSPFWVFGPEIKVEMPFLQPEVIRAALRVPLADKVNGAFYRRMVQAADPRIAALPSTNDEAPGTPAGPRRQTSPESLQSFTEQIRSSEVVMRLLTAEARKSITEPELSGRPGRQRRKLVMLHWASLFADWLQHYESRLAIEDFATD